MPIYSRYLRAARRLVADSDARSVPAIIAAAHRLEEVLSHIVTYGASEEERVRLARVIADLDRLCSESPQFGMTFQEYSRGDPVRRADGAPPSPDETVVKVLIAQCAPDGLLSLRQGEEFSAIEDGLGSSSLARFDLVFCHAARIRRLRQQVVDHAPAVIHFSGHGTADGRLMLHGVDGGADAVSVSDLVEAVRDHRGGLRLVFLNACWSDSQALAICSVSPCAIGVRERWSDDGAVVFARELYRCLGTGTSVGASFRSAVRALADASPGDAALPELRTARNVDADLIFMWGGSERIS